MANMDNGHDGAIFSEKDVKELSENLSRVFCKFVDTKIGDNHMLKKYINNYKALLHLPIFLEMQAEIDRLKTNLENDENEEHIKLEVEETIIHSDGGGGDMGESAYLPLHEEEVVTDEEEEAEEVEEEEAEEEEAEEEEVEEEEGGTEGTSGKGGHLPPEEDEEEMYEWEDEESGNKYYTNDPDGESGDIYECLEDEDVGEHIGTITDGKISLF